MSSSILELVNTELKESESPRDTLVKFYRENKEWLRLLGTEERYALAAIFEEHGGLRIAMQIRDREKNVEERIVLAAEIRDLGKQGQEGGALKSYTIKELRVILAEVIASVSELDKKLLEKRLNEAEIEEFFAQMQALVTQIKIEQKAGKGQTESIGKLEKLIKAGQERGLSVLLFERQLSELRAKNLELAV